MIKIDLKRHRKEIIGSVVVLLILLGGMSVFKYTSFNSGFEIVDDLGGNISFGDFVCCHHRCTSDCSVGFDVFGKSEVVYCRSVEIEDSL